MYKVKFIESNRVTFFKYRKDAEIYSTERNINGEHYRITRVNPKFKEYKLKSTDSLAKLQLKYILNKYKVIIEPYSQFTYGLCEGDPHTLYDSMHDESRDLSAGELRRYLELLPGISGIEVTDDDLKESMSIAWGLK